MDNFSLFDYQTAHRWMNNHHLCHCLRLSNSASESDLPSNDVVVAEFIKFIASTITCSVPRFRIFEHSAGNECRCQRVKSENQLFYTQHTAVFRYNLRGKFTILADICCIKQCNRLWRIVILLFAWTICIRHVCQEFRRP
jgi:hypothetical protein